MTVSCRRRRRLLQAHAPQAHAPHSSGRSRVRGAPDSAVRQRLRLSRTELTGRGASASSPCRPRPVTRVRRGESALAPRPQHGPPLNGAREACDDQAGRHGDSGGGEDPEDCVARGRAAQRHATSWSPPPGTLRGGAHPRSSCRNGSAWRGVCGSGDSPRNPGSRSCSERGSRGTAWRVAPRPPRGQELGVSTAGALVKMETPPHHRGKASR